MQNEKLYLIFVSFFLFNLVEVMQAENCNKSEPLSSFLNHLNFEEIPPQIWTPQTFQHFIRTTLSFQCDEPRLYLSERAETLTPLKSRRKHGKLSNIDVLMFYSRPFVIDSFLRKSQLLFIFSLRACVCINIFHRNLAAPVPPSNPCSHNIH